MRDPRTIGEVMNPAPYAIGADAPLRAAHAMMVRHRIHNLPVLRHGHPIGLLTDRDMHLVTYLANDLVFDDQLTAGDLCGPDYYVAAPDTPLAEVAARIADERLGAAMIVERNRLKGIFTAHDGCRLAAGRGTSHTETVQAEAQVLRL